MKFKTETALTFILPKPKTQKGIPKLPKIELHIH